MEAGSREDGEVRIVDGGEKKKVGFFLFFLFPVFIKSAAPELRRSWARDSCGRSGERISKMADRIEGEEPCCDR